MTTSNQIAIAKALPEVIGLHEIINTENYKTVDMWFYWRDTSKPVTDREWLTIMHIAEKTLTEAEHYEGYKMALSDICFTGKLTQHFIAVNCATDDQRAEALLRTVGFCKEAK